MSAAAKFVLGTLCSFATLFSCSVVGPEPDAAPWYAGARTSYGSASRLELVAGHYVDPAIAIGARVRNRVLLGAVVASAIGGGDDLDVDLLEVAGHVRLSPITSGSTRPWIDLLAGSSHAGATRGSLGNGLLVGSRGRSLAVRQ